MLLIIIIFVVTIVYVFCDTDGYDRDGFNKLGYDKDGYNRSGFNLDGYDRDGYDKNGFNREGYDKDGCNKAGLKKEENKNNHTPLSYKHNLIHYDYDLSDFGVLYNENRLCDESLLSDDYKAITLGKVLCQNSLEKYRDNDYYSLCNQYDNMIDLAMLDDYENSGYWGGFWDCYDPYI